tara:strand:- start:102 stop:662 length:561 start_codon:yes stop_codon:yes gene_type:complete
MSTLETNLIQPATGTSLTIGASGDTITIPSGATLTNSGTATGFGKILQVVQTNKQDMTSSSSTSYADISGMSVSITPSSTSSKVLVFFSASISTNNLDAQLKLLRDSTDIIGTGATSNATAFVRTANGDTVVPFNTMYLDSPSTTSATTYKLQWIMKVSGTVYLNRRMGDTSYGAISNITAMEVSA